VHIKQPLGSKGLTDYLLYQLTAGSTRFRIS